MAYFDIRIPGLKMTVVQADGNNVQPVTVDELRIAVAETYDVIVRPTKDMAYAIVAESMGRSAMVRGTLAPREGMVADVPPTRPPGLLTMADMSGMDMSGMDMSGMDMSGMAHGEMVMDDISKNGMTNGKADKMDGAAHKMPDGTTMGGTDHGAATADAPMAGMDHSAHGGMGADGADPFYVPGSGLTPAAASGGKFLSYADLKAQKPLYPDRPATREVEIRLTGNMERYIWSINGTKYADAEPIKLQYGERVRFKFVNETMMSHPMHLHGMWSILDNGSAGLNPAKHVISVAPGTTVYMETEVDAPGRWAFHCHLSYHMDAGMFREVVVVGGPEQQATLPSSHQGG